MVRWVQIPEVLQKDFIDPTLPEEGLTLPELQARLDETFTFLDKNKNGKLGWPELL